MVFMLKNYQVPDMPRQIGGTPWVDILRWMVCVMNPDDRSLHFIASVLSSAIKNEGKLSPKQAEVVEKIFKRVERDFDSEVLDCQLNDPDEDSEYDLAHLEAAGEA